MTDKTTTSERIKEEAEAQEKRERAGSESMPDEGLAQQAAAGAGSSSGDRRVTIQVRDLDFWYGDNHTLKDITLDVRANEVTAFIGPSGCGKSTLLRCLNRMNELIPGTRITLSPGVSKRCNVINIDE